MTNPLPLPIRRPPWVISTRTELFFMVSMSDSTAADTTGISELNATNMNVSANTSTFLSDFFVVPLLCSNILYHLPNFYPVLCRFNSEM